MPNAARKNKLEISDRIYKMINSSEEPVHINEEGHAEVVVMDAKVYEEYNNKIGILEVLEKLAEAEEDVKNGRIISYEQVKANLVAKHGIK